MIFPGDNLDGLIVDINGVLDRYEYYFSRFLNLSTTDNTGLNVFVK